jgi:hypothetical protein
MSQFRNTEQQQSDHIYYTLFLLVHSAAAAAPFTSPSNIYNCAKPKPFS